MMFFPQRMQKYGFGLVTVSLWLISLALAGQSAFAQYHTRNWDVDGLNGSIFATGSLVSAPCTLAAESAEQEIDLGLVNLQDLRKPGADSNPVPVNIVLEDCPGAAIAMRNTDQNRGSTWLSEQPAVRMRVSGESDPSDERLFKLHGGVSGVALRLEDSVGELMEPGAASRAHPLNPGRNNLQFNAQLERTTELLEPGEWNSVVNVDLEYE